MAALAVKDVVDMGLSPLESVAVYAKSHYSHGWDVVVEVVVEADILAATKGTEDPALAIRRVYTTYVKPYLAYIKEQDNKASI